MEGHLSPACLQCRGLLKSLGIQSRDDLNGTLVCARGSWGMAVEGVTPTEGHLHGIEILSGFMLFLLQCLESSVYWPTKRGITIYADPDIPGAR